MEKITFKKVGNAMIMDCDDLLGRTGCEKGIAVIPAVGRKVYVVSVSSKAIYEHEVVALGREELVIDGFMDCENFLHKMPYESYCYSWWLSYEDARAYLERYLTDDEVLEQLRGERKWIVKPLWSW